MKHPYRKTSAKYSNMRLQKKPVETTATNNYAETMSTEKIFRRERGRGKLPLPLKMVVSLKMPQYPSLKQHAPPPSIFGNFVCPALIKIIPGNYLNFWAIWSIFKGVTNKLINFCWMKKLMRCSFGDLVNKDVNFQDHLRA